MVCWSQDDWQVDSVGAGKRGRGRLDDVDDSLLYASGK